jgi:hypothetical protein
MMNFGWKRKAEQRRMALLSAGHQMAKEMPAVISRTLEIFTRISVTGDATGAQEALAQIPEDTAATKLLWEPIEIYGWKIQATFYLQSGQLWWLLRAVRRNEKAPSEKDIVFLDKILDHLGADPTRNMIIGPRSSPAGEEQLHFGWWTWFNRWPLYEVQVNKAKRGQDMTRLVPHGTRATEGYQSIDLSGDPGGDPEEKP